MLQQNCQEESTISELECRCEQKFVRFLERLHKIHSICVELIPAQVNSSCAVDRHSQRAAWCPGRLVSALMFLDTQQVLESGQMAT